VGVVDRIDEFQRRHPVVGFPLAVVYKFFDDQGNYLAAILTYYAFVAIFPLMLLGTSILGFVLGAKPEWQEEILDSVLGQFPIIGDQLGRPEGLQGSAAGIAFGALAALYGALGLAQSLQNAMHVAWSVPRNSRPNPFYARLKSLVLMVTGGVALLSVSILSTVASTTTTFFEQGERWLLSLVNVLVIGVGLTVLFRFAATGQHSFLRAAPGGFSLAVMWQLLQLGGALYVAEVLVGTSSMTKTFGLVLGLVGFLFIGAVMAVLAMEVNVVIARRLYPRALLTPFTDAVTLTDADRRAYAAYARMQRHKGFERVSVSWGESDTEPDPAPDTAPDPAP
jgi:YihY family inner membrane protein